MKPEKYRSAALSAIHETMTALHEAGAAGKQTMREFDAACLTPVRLLSGAKINPLAAFATQGPAVKPLVEAPFEA